MELWLERFGEGPVLALLGLLVGVAFGIAAQHSRFCLRAATVEVAEGSVGPRLGIWLVAFFSALLAVQGAIAFGWLSVVDARQIASPGSLSGAVVGGLMFGAGMILARGCASRLLVLSASGNLRAIITGLVLTLVAQASLTGVFAPAREAIAALWQVPGGSSRDLAALLGLSPMILTGIAAVALLASALYARHSGIALTRGAAAAGVGLAVAAGWLGTAWVARNSFEVVAITSVTFTGPSTDTLMGFVTARSMPFSFGIGLVPGVVIGAGGAALLAREFRIERFGPDTPMERYLVGAFLMGFGSMLAGGCAVGAGMSGGAIMALTAWVAVGSMWAGAMLTHRLMLWRSAAGAQAA